MKSSRTPAMHKAYRFCFFEDDAAHAAAVLVLHFASDNAASDEAIMLLAASSLTRIEVWQGTRKIFQHARLAPRFMHRGYAASA
jgi:hypothetical protein